MEAMSRTMPTKSPRLALVLVAAPGGGGGETTAGGGGEVEFAGLGAGAGTGPGRGAGPGAGPGDCFLGAGAGAGTGARGGRGGRLNVLVGDCANSRVGGRAVFCTDDEVRCQQSSVNEHFLIHGCTCDVFYPPGSFCTSIRSISCPGTCETWFSSQWTSHRHAEDQSLKGKMLTAVPFPQSWIME